MTCYVCGAQVDATEAERIADAIDAEVEDGDETTIDNLDLVHCSGPDDQFLADGRVIVCADCFDRAHRATESALAYFQRHYPDGVQRHPDA